MTEVDGHQTGGIWFRLAYYCFCIYIYLFPLLTGAGPAGSCWALTEVISNNKIKTGAQPARWRNDNSTAATHTRPYDSRRWWPAYRKLDSPSSSYNDYVGFLFVSFFFFCFSCVFLFLFPCCWWSSLEGTGNKSSAKKINQWLYSIGFVFQFLLFWAVASLMCVDVYILAAQ